MKEIKAYVRTSRVEETVKALREAGAPGVTACRVHAAGYGYDPLDFTLAPGEIHRAPEVAKIEVVCGDQAVESLVAVIVNAARTGVPGDGIVLVAPVERAMRIRTGEGIPAIPASPQERERS